MITLQNLIETLPQQGRVEWLGIRGARKLPLTPVEQVEATKDRGLEGDHYSKISGKRQVTLIQAEHLDAVAVKVPEPLFDFHSRPGNKRAQPPLPQKTALE